MLRAQYCCKPRGHRAFVRIVWAILGLLCLALSATAWAVDVPFKFDIADKQSFEGVGKLEGRHFSGDARSGAANVHLEGDIRQGELTIQATGDMLPGYSVERNLVASGSIRPARGKVQFPLQFSSSHGLLSNMLYLDLPTDISANTVPSAGTANTASPEFETIDQTYVAVVPAKVREKPDPLSARIKTIEVGQKINVVGRLKGQDWYLVSENDKPLGYVIVDQLVPESQYAGNSTVSPPSATEQSGTPIDISKLDYGHYTALVIGNSSYRNGLKILKTAAADAREVAQVLRSNYGFAVTLLTDATREQIFEALTQLRLTLTWNDNLLIYYSGHGSFDEAGGQGYWLPVDADPDDPTNWLSNADVTTMMRAIRARHILVVAESGYAGALTAYSYAGPKDASYIARAVARKARTVLTSGGLQPVTMAGGGHSVFASAFIAVLRQNRAIMDAQTFSAKVRDASAASKSALVPQYSSLRPAGDEGGDFIFVRKAQ